MLHNTSSEGWVCVYIFQLFGGFLKQILIANKHLAVCTEFTIICIVQSSAGLELSVSTFHYAYFVSLVHTHIVKRL